MLPTTFQSFWIATCHEILNFNSIICPWTFDAASCFLVSCFLFCLINALTWTQLVGFPLSKKYSIELYKMGQSMKLFASKSRCASMHIFGVCANFSIGRSKLKPSKSSNSLLSCDGSKLVHGVVNLKMILTVVLDGHESRKLLCHFTVWFLSSIVHMKDESWRTRNSASLYPKDSRRRSHNDIRLWAGFERLG